MKKDNQIKPSWNAPLTKKQHSKSFYEPKKKKKSKRAFCYIYSNKDILHSVIKCFITG